MAQFPLTTWMQTLVDYVRSGEPDLTNRQMALLLLVHLTNGPHTVRGLARGLGVSKPVVTRALNRLGSLGYLRRQRDDSDRRNIFVILTSEGAKFLEQFGRLIAVDRGERMRRERLALTGHSTPLDPATHAVRPDLADIELADRVFAPHYARAVDYRLARDAELRTAAAEAAEARAFLSEGDPFGVLDISGGYAWGKAADGTPGYLPMSALSR